MADRNISVLTEESTAFEVVVGCAWTQVLISSSERDLSSTAVLGKKLVEELLKRGVVIAKAAPK
jgi:hypothetical protein